jgi:hypothetical protein
MAAVLTFFWIALARPVQGNDRILVNDIKPHSERHLIINGVESIPGRYPYMASLAEMGYHKCGGTVSVCFFKTL